MNISEPTAEQCRDNALVFQDEHSVAYAIWYPQMGGYCAKAVAIMSRQWKEYENGSAEGGCIDMLIWHDGEFPFHEGDEKNPIHLHHCDPHQFITFGKTLAKINDANCIHLP